MYSSWIGLVTMSLLVSLAAFVWALRDGQFSDQGRARYLPLHDEFSRRPVEHRTNFSLEVWVLLFIVVLGSLGIAGSLILSLWRFRKG